MKLAEALILQTNLQQKIEQSKHRLTTILQIQEGDKPQEDPQKIFKDLELTFSKLAEITKKINQTNSRTGLGAMTLAEVLAEIDMLSLKYQVYNDIFQAASDNFENLHHPEFYINAFKVSELKTEMEKLSTQYKELESKVQEIRWRIDLLERW